MYLNYTQCTVWKQCSKTQWVVCSRLPRGLVFFSRKALHLVIVMTNYKQIQRFFVVSSISAPGALGGCSTVVSTHVRRQAAPSSTWLTTWYSIRSLPWSTTTSRWRCAAMSLRWSWLSQCLRPMLTRAKSESQAGFRQIVKNLKWWSTEDLVDACFVSI